MQLKQFLLLGINENEEIEHLSAYIHHSMFNLQDK